MSEIYLSLTLLCVCCVMATRRRGRGQGSGLPNLAQVNERVTNVTERVEAMDARTETMAKSIETMMAMLNNLTQQQQETASQSGTRTEDSSDRHVGGRDVNGEEDYLKYLDRFQKMNPKRFRGTSDPDKAEEWALLLDKYFAGLRCPDEYKVSLAVMTLEGEAEHWWRALQRRAVSMQQPVTWRYFITAFYDKYFSRTARIRKATEFDALRQGKMSVDEYEAKFSALIRFAPQVEADNLLKATKFRDGLRYNIRKAILGEEDYFNIVQKAQEAERDLQREETERKAAQMDPNEPQRLLSQRRSGYFQRTNKRMRGEVEVKPTPTPSSDICTLCGRSHVGRPCYRRMKVCYVCGQPGHFIANCPYNTKTFQPSNSKAPPKPKPTTTQSGVQGRVYSLIREEVIPPLDRVSGMLLLLVI